MTADLRTLVEAWCDAEDALERESGEAKACRTRAWRQGVGALTQWQIEDVIGRAKRAEAAAKVRVRDTREALRLAVGRSR